jgi:excisionase family DNA binding protein
MNQHPTASRLEGRVKTLKEVAAILRISRGSAYEAAKRKEIPTIRIGRRLLVPSAALERLLAGDTQPPDHTWQSTSSESKKGMQ